MYIVCETQKRMQAMPAHIEVSRNGFIESLHEVDYFILKKDQVLAASEETKHLIFPRSSIKLLQAYDFVASGAYKQTQSSRLELALACASHNSEDKQVMSVKNWLKKNKVNEEHLYCGPALPRRNSDLIDFAKSGKTLSKAYNNCSGKHTAMVLNALHLGLDPKTYHQANHPIQKRFIKNLEELCNMKLDLNYVGEDGCGLPNYQMSLEHLAIAMMAMLKLSEKDSEEGLAAREVFHAVKEHSYYLGGSDRLCSEIIKISKGRILAKVGAEGVYTAVIPEEEVSLALKVKDGSFRAVEAALAGLLQYYSLLNEKEEKDLQDWIERPISNTLNHKVGKIHLKI